MVTYLTRVLAELTITTDIKPIQNSGTATHSVTRFNTLWSRLGSPIQDHVVRLLTTLLWMAGLMASAHLYAGEPVQLRNSFAGYLSFELAAGAFRNSDTNTCSLNSTASGTLATFPAGSTVTHAFLYWTGSYNSATQNPDYDVTFNNISVSADRRYTDLFVSNGTNYEFFNGIADVTSIVQTYGAGTYTMRNLSVNTGSPHCNNSTVTAGWAMVVIYENAAEPLRVLNIFDGFQHYQGSSITLTPNNFVVANTPSGKHAHITWEGDEGNSTSLNGFSETLTFQGNVLTDATNPANNQFNSRSNIYGTQTLGLDVDAYDIGNKLVAGETSVSTYYSSGQDLVFLSAEIISVANAPVADLAISSSSANSVNTQNNYPLVFNVSNNGPIASGNFSTDITLPSSMNYTGFSGTNWSCNLLSGSTYRCNYTGSVAKDASAPALTINTYVPYSAANSLSITATVTGSLFDNIQANDSLTKVISLNKPLFDTSIKTLEDLNGGTVNPGDTLRYTLSIKETGGVAASQFSITDNIPANISSYAWVNLPAGSDDQSSTTGGSNGTGLIDLRNLSIAANGTLTLVYDAVVSNSASNGAAIANSFNILLDGTNAQNINANTVYIAGNTNGLTYNKPLYINTTTTLSRSAPAISTSNILAENGGSVTYALNPTLQKNLILSGQYAAYPITLNLATTGTRNRTISYSITLGYGTNSLTNTIATFSTTQTLTPSPDTYIYNLDVAGTSNIPAGNKIFLNITNTTFTNRTRELEIFSLNNGQATFVGLQASTVIAVDSLAITDAANNPITNAYTGEPLNISTTISDPFGEADISNVLLEIYDANGNLVSTLNATSLSLTDSDASLATKTFTFNYTPNATTANAGMWKFRVVAQEGNEGWVEAYASQLFEIKIPVPEIILNKTLQVISDPVNGTQNPKAIPGAIVQYSISAINQGKGATDNNSVVIADAIPDNTTLLVNDFDASTSGPIKFVDGISPANSGLSYTFSALNSTSDNIEFSSDGTDYTYTPSADANGADNNIRFFRIRPSGAMGAASVTAQPQFEFHYKVTLH